MTPVFTRCAMLCPLQVLTYQLTAGSSSTTQLQLCSPQAIF
jgi:hypothetical protein